MRHLLLLDTDGDFRADLQSRLKEHGFETASLTPETADEVVDYIHQNDVEAVLIDIYIPGGVNGFDVVKVLRERLPDVPVIILSKTKNPHSVLRALELGCETYLEKPVNIQDLQAKLESVLKKKAS